MYSNFFNIFETVFLLVLFLSAFVFLQFPSFQSNLIYLEYITFRKPVYPYKNQGRAFIGMTTMVKDKHRHILSNETWMYKFTRFSKHRVLYVMENHTQSLFSHISVDPIPFTFIENPKARKRDRNIALKRITALKYFIEQTNYEWFLSSCDDLYINLEGFNQMLADLEQKYNPRKDIVLKGQIVERLNKSYLQGGTGYLFSRAAAIKFLPFATEWLNHIYREDDYHSWEIIKDLGLSPDDTLTPYMFGSDLKALFNFTNILKKQENCKNRGNIHQVSNKGYYPLNKLSVIHGSSPNDDKQLVMNNIRRAVHLRNDLYFYNGKDNKFHLCEVQDYIVDDLEYLI